MTLPGKCDRCPVRRTALCAGLSDSELRVIEPSVRLRKIRRNQPLMWAGDCVGVTGNVVTGLLKISANTSEGHEQIVGLVYPSGLIGNPFPSVSKFEVVALTDVTLCVLPQGYLEKLIVEHQALHLLLLQRTMMLLDEARSRMVMLARQSAQSRVASFLLTLAPSHPEAAKPHSQWEDLPVDLPLSRSELANVLGLTIETVSRQFTRLKQTGVISIRGHRELTIRRRSMLASLAEAG